MLRYHHYSSCIKVCNYTATVASQSHAGACKPLTNYAVSVLTSGVLRTTQACPPPTFLLISWNPRHLLLLSCRIKHLFFGFNSVWPLPLRCWHQPTYRRPRPRSVGDSPATSRVACWRFNDLDSIDPTTTSPTPVARSDRYNKHTAYATPQQPASTLPCPMTSDLA
jgi:hypothetical protein